MDRLREITSVALSLRKQAGLRVRLPVARLTVVASDATDLAGLGTEILADELNVKSVEFVVEDAASAARYGVTERLAVNARALGPRIGRQVQAVIQAAKAGNWRSEHGVVVVGDVELFEGEYELVLERAGGADREALGLVPSGGFVLLSTEITPELELEGRARDFIRDVQQARRTAGLDVTDRIELGVEGDPDLLRMLEVHGELVKRETLTEVLEVAPATVGSTDRVQRWPDGTLTRIPAGNWGATDGARFELRKTGDVVLDV
jgi:isoleucyl-tRNA synthetase